MQEVRELEYRFPEDCQSQYFLPIEGKLELGHRSNEIETGRGVVVESRDGRGRQSVVTARLMLLPALNFYRGVRMSSEERQESVWKGVGKGVGLTGGVVIGVGGSSNETTSRCSLTRGHVAKVIGSLGNRSEHLVSKE